MSFIAIEEHFAAKANFATNRAHDFYSDNYSEEVVEGLTSFGQHRLKEMEVSNTRMQVVSYTPIYLSVSEAVVANNAMSEGANNDPTHFAAFAALPMHDLPAAVAELERAVEDLGMLGALIPNHVDGEFYDGENWRPLFRKAQELDVPIYLHPTAPSKEMHRIQYQGNFSETASTQLGRFGLGWHSQVGLHVLRLFASGLFDECPRLKIIIGHMGEMLPFQLDRILRFADQWGSYKRGLREVWDNNLWITTAGMFTLAPMACLLRTTRVDRILYSLDYPLAPAHLGKQFMEELQASDLVTEEEFEGIGFKDAERLLGIQSMRAS